MQRIFINKYISVYVGSVYRVKAVHNWVGKRFADDEEVETEVQK
jgi:hypothetical protein